MGPPQSSPNGERHQDPHQAEQSGQNGHNGSSEQLVGAAAAAQQPKVVQTAFIHKLYKSVPTVTLAVLQRLTIPQYVGRPDHITPHLLGEQQ
jgi:hypothetical protein